MAFLKEKKENYKSKKGKNKRCLLATESDKTLNTKSQVKKILRVYEFHKSSQRR